MGPTMRLLAWSIVSYGLSASAAQPPGLVAAARANDFIETMGVGAGPERAEELAELGLRHYRSGFDPYNIDLINGAYAAHGLKGDMIARTSDMAQVVDLMTRITPGAIDDFEGPNEVNNLFGSCDCNFKYLGLEDGPAAILFMQDIAAAFDAEPALADVPIASFTQIYGPNYLPDVSGQFPFDLANWHPYPAWGPPTFAGYGADNIFRDLAGDHYGSVAWNYKEAQRVEVGEGPPKPLLVSEAGYNYPSHLAQAKYTPMLYADWFNHGVYRTLVFTLVDQEGFGWMDPVDDTLVKRPVYFAIRDLVSLLNDATWDPVTQQWVSVPFEPAALSLTIEGATEGVYHTLLQKSDGTFLLLLWNEVPNFDLQTWQDIVNPPVPVTLRLSPSQIESATLHVQQDDGHYLTEAATIVDGALSVQVLDHMTVVALRGAPSVETAPPAAESAADDTGDAPLAEGGQGPPGPGGCGCDAGAQGGAGLGFLILLAAHGRRLRLRAAVLGRKRAGMAPGDAAIAVE